MIDNNDVNRLRLAEAVLETLSRYDVLTFVIEAFVMGYEKSNDDFQEAWDLIFGEED